MAVNIEATDALGGVRDVDGILLRRRRGRRVRRMEQEASDAEYAASLPRQEVEASTVSREVAEDVAIFSQDDVNARRRMGRRRRIHIVITFLVGAAFAFVMYRFLAAAATAVAAADGIRLTQKAGSATGRTGKRDMRQAIRTATYPGSWPRRAPDPASTYECCNLDKKWQDTFFAIMIEWGNGTPDAVSFRIKGIPNSSCGMVRGAMVVCNGDYGRTSWRGINELQMTPCSLVVTLRAKLNAPALVAPVHAGSLVLRTVGHGLCVDAGWAAIGADCGPCHAGSLD